MAYSHTTYLQLRQALAARLGDTSNVYWRDVELGRYINEALRTWSSFSAFWRARATFPTAASTPFYALPVGLPALRAYNVTDRDLVKDVMYALLEDAGTDPTGAAWVGTDMYTLDDVTAAIQRRLNQFIQETGCVVTHTTSPVPSDRVVLPDSTIDVRRVNWKAADGSQNTLWRATEWELISGALHWDVNPARPYAYGMITTPPLTVQLMPHPNDVGNLDLILVQSGPTLTPTVSATALGVPDDLTWVIKWGALADLLGKDAQARDPNRAAFCEQRYQLGVQLAQQSACVIQALLQGESLIMDDLEAVDAAYPGWQGIAATTPTTILTVGLNMVGAYPVPDGIYSLTFDVVQNAPVLTNDADFVQLGREQLDALIDYSEHLAAFKMGGAEFDMTLRQADNFMRQAATYNERVAALGLFSTPTASQSRQEEQRRVRRRKATALVTD